MGTVKPSRDVPRDSPRSDLPRRFRLNVATNYVTTVTAIVVALVGTPILVHGLGKLEYGVWVLVGSTILYLDLFNLGFSRATVKYVAEYHSLNDLERVRRTIATSFIVLSVPAMLALLIGIGLAFAFPPLFHLPASLRTAATLLVIMTAVDLVISIPGDSFGGTLIALQRYDLLNLTLVTVTVGQLVAWIVILELGGGLVALGAATVALSLVGQLARYLLVRRLVPGVSISRRYFDRAFIRPLAGLSAWIAVTDVAGLLIARMDTIIVGLLVGVPEAGVYAVGQKLALLADRAIHPAVQTLFPHAAGLAAHHDKSGLRRLLSVGTRISMALALPVTLVLIILAGPALRAWVGPKFADATLVVVFLAAATAVTALTYAGMHVLRGVGEARVPALAVSAEALLNFALSIILGSTMGMKGVALATLIAATVIHLGVLLPYLGRYFGLSVASLTASIARANLPAIVATVGVGYLFRREEFEGIPEVIAVGAALAAIYGLCFFGLGLRTEERQRLLARVRS